MSLLRFCEWLAATPGSIALHESRYMFLAILMIHVLTLSVLVGTAVMVDLRLLGLTLQRVPTSEVMARLLPWSGGGFLVMIASGSLWLSLMRGCFTAPCIARWLTGICIRFRR